MIEAASQPVSTEEWWRSRRLLYNFGLAVAGVVAFVCYALVLDDCISKRIFHDAEITVFTTLFQGIGYLFMMLVANVCYELCPASEKKVKPANVVLYRRITFGLGFWFSVLLPFSIPALTVAACA